MSFRIAETVSNVAQEYLRSKACRREFGHIDHDKIFIYVEQDKHLLVNLEIYMSDLFRTFSTGNLFLRDKT